MFSILLHPDVIKFLDSLPKKEKERCVKALRMLKENPFTQRSKADVKKLKGKDKVLYRLRVGDYRFEYFVEEKIVYVVEAFRRKRGYRK
jgi:mRNA-degrading endonuclease RelE of RelBE toxin-antitoxin system